MAGIEEFYLISTSDPNVQPFVQNDVLSFPIPPFEGDEAWQLGRLAGYYAVPKGQIDGEELEWLEDHNIVYSNVSFNESNQVIGGNF
jgi:hypothetical protein